MASLILYNNFKLKQMAGPAVDFDGDTIKLALIEGTYSPDIDADEFFADVEGDEVSSSGYTAGGQALTGLVVNLDTINNRAVIDADDLTWVDVTITPRYAVLYKVVGSPSTDPLIGYIDFGADQEAVGVDFQIRWSTDGILWAV